jgi:hypothetical protein
MRSQQAIEEAVKGDQARHVAAMAEYQTKLADWEALQRIAQGVLLGDVTAFKAALEELNPFQEIHEIGRSVQLNFNDRYIEVTTTLHGIDHVPTETKSLLKTGKVSIKKMSVGAVNELYQRHCCSAILRVARELFAVLPFKYVYAHGLTELLNQSTVGPKYSLRDSPG